MFRFCYNVTALRNAHTETVMPPRHLTYANLAATERAGTEPAAFVFLHGLTFDRRMWDPIMAALPSAHRAIALDLPGHGGSRPFAARGLDAVVDEVHAAVAAAGVDAPIVIGHSIGGPIASIYASAHPAAGVVSVEAPIRLEPFAAMLAAVAPQLTGPGFGQFWPQLEGSMRLDRVPAEHRDLLRGDAGSVQDLFVRYQADLLDRPLAKVVAWRDEGMAAIAAGGVPYLSLLVNEPPAADIAWLRERVPQAEVVVWPVGHHFPHLARPALFADLLGELARRAAVAG
jgi:pimeloyl-ACP methyl ester carboxylesterase